MGASRAVLFIHTLSTICLAKEMSANRAQDEQVPGRQLQLFSFLDPLADVLAVQEQQDHSLIHMSSGHAAAGSLMAASDSSAGADMAEALLEDQPQSGRRLAKTPQQARAHSLTRSEALARLRSQQPGQDTITEHAPPLQQVLAWLLSHAAGCIAVSSLHARPLSTSAA